MDVQTPQLIVGIPIKEFFDQTLKPAFETSRTQVTPPTYDYVLELLVSAATGERAFSPDSMPQSLPSHPKPSENVGRYLSMDLARRFFQILADKTLFEAGFFPDSFFLLENSDKAFKEFYEQGIRAYYEAAIRTPSEAPHYRPLKELSAKFESVATTLREVRVGFQSSSVTDKDLHNLLIDYKYYQKIGKENPLVKRILETHNLNPGYLQ